MKRSTIHPQTENTVTSFPQFQVILSKQKQMFKQNWYSDVFTNEMQNDAGVCVCLSFLGKRGVCVKRFK